MKMLTITSSFYYLVMVTMSTSHLLIQVMIQMKIQPLIQVTNHTSILLLMLVTLILIQVTTKEAIIPSQ